jgi:hypothetical protein
MTATAFLELKQRATKLSEKEQRSLSAFLIQLGQARTGRKQETARRPRGPRKKIVGRSLLAGDGLA